MLLPMSRPNPRPQRTPDTTLGNRPGDLAEAGSWGDRSIPAWALLPLRLFLGFTFVYAGLQKLADPNFFNSGSSSSIQEQLRAASRASPIGSLLGPLSHLAVPIGALIAFGELAVGVGTLLGLWSRLAAFGGLLLSLGFLLAVSWHSDPYYLGPDVVFCFAWSALLSPPGPWTVDRALAVRNAAYAQATRRPLAPVDLQRRELLARGRFAAMAAVPVLVGGGVAAVFGRAFHRGPNSSSAPSLNPSAVNPTTPAPTSQESSGGSSTTAAPRAPASPAHSGTLVGSASAVPVGGAATFTDPATGSPALVVQAQAGQFKAFSAVCPHQGCTVDYSRSQRIFICPCHGAEFDATNGAVQRGPARDPLPGISVVVRTGQLYVDG